MARSPKIPESIFRSYDIRGTTDQLSPELARRVGAATVKFTGAKRVVVGRDMRETSPAFARAVIAGITSQGAEAVDIGKCTTPMFNFAVFAYEAHEAGVMVTASHNPAEYNGFKMSRGDGFPISGEEIKPLVLANSFQHATRAGKRKTLNVMPEYLERVFALANMPSLKGMRVVVDAGNGMGGIILPKLFKRLDCEMTPLYFEPDGTFPHHEANPIKPETLEDLQGEVAHQRADIGIALDGDADRIGFVDEKGQFVNGDHMLALLAGDRLRAHKGGAVVWSPNASWAVRDAIVRGGGRSVFEKVGRIHIARRVQKEKAAIGGEVSAHYFYPEFGGMESTEFTLLLVLKLLAESGKSFSELLKSVRTYATLGEVNFEVKEKDAVLAALEKHYASKAVAGDKLDGLRLEFKDWWFNVRKSNTEPLIRLNLEAKTSARMKEKHAELAKFIESHAG
ncbi:MAG: Phosphomannomutase [Candidatus Uhrbacteria bacterium GW2011_GWA2_53_10]|uniref:Phosphomannomutase n=1 Tax=Candidatus Uhrbacteria bacterium GW2011_GWA2_53_10 TaxID=1618980 RepID=A0A0G2AI06_9BACT|nr:MAG: Phosphomannomutase [Candidatus Uhrbacteria bacterium GW2011_GWA2_53_10]